MGMEILQSDWIRKFLINSISNPYLKIFNYGLRYPIQIRNSPLSCTLAKIFGNVYFSSWEKGFGYFTFSQTRLAEMSTDQDWAKTEKIFVVLMWLFWKYQTFYLWSDFTGLLNGQRWADCEVFHAESSPDLMKLNPIQSCSGKFLKITSPIQSWSSNANSCVFFASWGKRTTGAILPLAKCDWLKGK